MGWAKRSAYAQQEAQAAPDFADALLRLENASTQALQAEGRHVEARRTSRPASCGGAGARRTSRPASCRGAGTRRTSRPASCRGAGTRRTSRPALCRGAGTRRTSRPASCRGAGARRTSHRSPHGDMCDGWAALRLALRASCLGALNLSSPAPNFPRSALPRLC